MGIYEVVKNTADLQRLIMAEGNSLEIDTQMRKDGFNDLRTSGPAQGHARHYQP